MSINYVAESRRHQGGLHPVQTMLIKENKSFFKKCSAISEQIDELNDELDDSTSKEKQVRISKKISELYSKRSCIVKAITTNNAKLPAHIAKLYPPPKDL